MVETKLCGVYGDYQIFEKEGKFYALLSSTTDDNIEELIITKKAIESDELEQLKSSIDESVKWANTRGVSGLEEADQPNAIRANSYNVLDDKSHKFVSPKVIVLNDGVYLVEKNDYDTIFMNDSDAKRFFLSAVSEKVWLERIFTYKEHDIFMYDKVYYAIHQSHGQVQWHLCDAEMMGAILSRLLQADSTKGVMEKIDLQFHQEKNQTTAPEQHIELQEKMSFEQLEPETVETNGSADRILNDKVQEEIEDYKGFTIYKFENTFFAKPKSSARLNVALDDFFERDDVFYDVSIAGLREVINSQVC